MWTGRTIIFFLLLAAFWIGGWVFVRLSLSSDPVYYPEPRRSYWEYQVIDTMKYSRDLAGQMLDDPNFDPVIERQVREIAEAGATHVAIATPYDEEFVPFLTRWVEAARANGLRVWFRGNLSGWEGWFDYPKIGRQEHIKKVRDFIMRHPDLFQNGDLFTPCPECENGGSGDPRKTGDVEGFRHFIIESHQSADAAFRSIGVLVDTRLFSMNGDVARLVMDEKTTAALGNVITVDHYVKTPEKLESDVRAFGKDGTRKVFLGEFGAPIPDIHGKMSDLEQALWLDQSLARLSRVPNLIGASYWLSVGGSTELWTDKGEPRPAVAVLRKYFRPQLVYGFVTDELGRPVRQATVSVGKYSTQTDTHGHFQLRFLEDGGEEISVAARGFKTQSMILSENEEVNYRLEPEYRSVPYIVMQYLKTVFGW
jgi:hypothetical protein